MQIVLPKVTLDPKVENLPFFYLLGPVQGGGDWQKRCCEELEHQVDGDFLVAVPCRWDSTHPLAEKFYSGVRMDIIRQCRWERPLLKRAGIEAEYGSIITWLPLESKDSPRNDGQPYARDTYGVLGEWRTRLEFDESSRFCWGGNTDFPGLEVINECSRDAFGEGKFLPFYSTMTNLVTHAVKIAYKMETSIRLEDFIRLPRY